MPSFPTEEERLNMFIENMAPRLERIEARLDNLEASGRILLAEGPSPSTEEVNLAQIGTWNRRRKERPDSDLNHEWICAGARTGFVHPWSGKLIKDTWCPSCYETKQRQT